MTRIKGQIIKGIGGFYYIRPIGSTSLLEAKPRGIFRHQKITPTVGDWVELSEESGKLTIEAIEARRNIFVRPPVANVDLALIVFAACNPTPNLLLLDKLLIASEYEEVEPIICVTKRDLADPAELEKLREIYGASGYTLLFLAKDDPESLRALEALLKGHTAFMAGPSGVGKSTLANHLCGEVDMEIGDLSQKLGRGKHTTRHVQLLEMDCGGFLLDTPGFSSLNVAKDISLEALRYYFPEFSQGHCRFSSCTHRSEPGCAVKAQVDNEEISATRYAHYLQLYEEIEKRGR